MSREHLQLLNKGPLICQTNYWQSELAKRQFFLVSLHRETVRILLPPYFYGHVESMFPATETLIYFYYNEERKKQMAKIVFNDNSDNPYWLHGYLNQFDRLPSKHEYNAPFDLTIWIEENSIPKNVLSGTCHFIQSS